VLVKIFYFSSDGGCDVNLYHQPHWLIL